MLFCPAINFQTFSRYEKHPWKPPAHLQFCTNPNFPSCSPDGQGKGENAIFVGPLCLLNSCIHGDWSRNKIRIYVKSPSRADYAYGLFWLNEAPAQCIHYAQLRIDTTTTTAVLAKGAKSGLCFHLRHQPLWCRGWTVLASRRPSLWWAQQRWSF